MFMTKKNFAHLFTVVLLLVFVSITQAQTSVWDSLGSNLNNEIAVKAKNKKTVFGILTNQDSDTIKVRTSDKKNVTEVSFNREEVEKIWQAKLSESSRNTLLGAGIGAAVGAGIGLVALSTVDRDNGGGAYGAAVPIYAVVGAVIGGTAGFFIRKSGNKKERLIYRQ